MKEMQNGEGNNSIILATGKQRHVRARLPGMSTVQAGALALDNNSLVVGVRQFFLSDTKEIDATMRAKFSLPIGAEGYDLERVIHAFEVISAFGPRLSDKGIETIVSMTYEPDEKVRSEQRERIASEWAKNASGIPFFQKLLQWGAGSYMKGVETSGYDPLNLQELTSSLDQNGVKYDARGINRLNEMNLSYALAQESLLSGNHFVPPYIGRW